MNVRELLTKWGFKIEHEKLDKVEEQLEGIKRRLEFLGAVEVAKGLFELTERFAHFAEQLEIGATAAGVTVEAMQQLILTSAQFGVESGELTTSVRKLSMTLYQARNGSEQALNAFTQLGISPTQVLGFKNADQALLAMADRLKNIKDPIARAALAQQTLGRSSQAMLNYLSKGSAALIAQRKEVEELGLVLSGEQVEALAEANRSFGRFGQILRSIGLSIAADIAPVFKLLIEDFQKFFRANRDLIEVNIITWLGDLAYTFGFVWEAVKFGIDLFIRFAKALGIQDRIFEIVASVVGLVLGLIAAHKAVQLVINGFLTVQKVFGVAQSVIKGLSTAWEFLTGVEWASLAPILPFVAAVGLLVVAVQGLWTVLSGGSIDDTWIGQFWNWLKSFTLLRAPLQFIEDFLASILDSAARVQVAISELGIGGAFKKITDNVGGFFGADDKESPLGRTLDTVGNVAGFASTVTPPASASQYMVDAPITVNVPAGTNPKEVGDKVKEGVAEHLQRVYRETQRSTATPVAY